MSLTFYSIFVPTFAFAFIGIAVLSTTEAVIRVVPITYFNSNNGEKKLQQPQYFPYVTQQYYTKSYKNVPAKESNDKMSNWNTNPSLKEKADEWDRKMPAKQADQNQLTRNEQQPGADQYQQIYSNHLRQQQTDQLSKQSFDQYKPVYPNGDQQISQKQNKQEEPNQYHPVLFNNYQQKQQADPNQLDSQNVIQPKQQSDQYQPVFPNQLTSRQQYQQFSANQFQQNQNQLHSPNPYQTNRFQSASPIQYQPNDQIDQNQSSRQTDQNKISQPGSDGRNKFTPWNVHSLYYTSYDECDPWCRAHCATKRTPEFCFRVGPCLNNCYRIVTNFLRARRM